VTRGARVAGILLLACSFGAGLAGCKRDPAKSQPPAPAQPAPPPAAADTLEPALTAAVKAYRQTIVLMWDQGTLPAVDRPNAVVVGRMLFEGNLPRLQEIGDRLGKELDEAAAIGYKKPLPLMDRFLATLENEPSWHDADKLVFRDLVEDLAERLQQLAPASPAGKALVTRITEDRKALQEIQALYAKEMDQVFSQFQTRGMPVRREAWERYLGFLRTLFSAPGVMEEHRAEIAPAAAAPRPGASVRPPAPADLSAVLSGGSLPEKTLVLTFDDGPHPKHTAAILEILERFKAKAIFFEVGQNLGGLDEKGSFRTTRAGAESRKVLAAGNLIGNHTYTHPFLPKLSKEQVEGELDLGSRMLKGVEAGVPTLFRPPYGATNGSVQEDVASRKMKTMLWNIDSQDWADPIPVSIANRVIGEARERGRGVILLHDIHARSVQALPLIMETLQAEGFRFALWDGERLLDVPVAQAPGAPAGPPPQLYRETWAVVIGINDYQRWPKLGYAVNDARAMQALLVEKFAVKPENITLLLDGEATRERIMAALGDALSDPGKVKRDDRVLIFFAGHGATRLLPSGKSIGYIIPVEADTAGFQGQSISMTTFQDINEGIPAKHVFYVMDACYSGLALVRGGAPTSADPHRYLQEITRRQTREMITAGGADQQVADGGPGGHSIFTWTVLQGLQGKADMNADGYITAAELFTYAAPIISSLSAQTPAFGNLVGSEGGEFVFELPAQTEFLSSVSQQLDDEALTLNAQLEAVRKTIADKRVRNEALQKELAAAKRELTGLGERKIADTTAEKARKALLRGLAFFREKRYPEALAAFEESYALQPSSAQVANNIGFVHYRTGKAAEALRWYEKTLALDPNRAIAWANTGEAYEQLDRKDEALKAYEKFLAIAPDHPSVAYVRERIRLIRQPG
jgi:peptidoglycan/xylan/chitin deacetylase (PgdA/CDA1 family)/tetratricopeptide (TPR) repeat protein